MERLQVCGFFFSLIVLTVAQNNTHSHGPDPSYLLLTPSTIRPGVPTSVSITVLMPSTVTVTAHILHNVEIVAENSAEVEGGSTQLLTLPPIHSSGYSHGLPYTLEVKGHIGRKELFSNSTRLHYDPKGLASFIQTDRTQYRPGETVKVRVVSVHPDGKPHGSSVDVNITDPKGNLVSQWRQEKSHLGVVALEFELSENPPLGHWTIRATVESVSTKKHFAVEHYVLPKFKVDIEVPAVARYGDTMTVLVTAKYWYGKPVDGHVNMTFIYSHDEVYDAHYEDREISGSTEFEFDVRDYNSRLTKRSFLTELLYRDKTLLVMAQVTESLTGLTYDSMATVFLTYQKYKISIEGFPRILRPSLNFMGMLKISRYDGQPLSDEDREMMANVSVIQKRKHPGMLEILDRIEETEEMIGMVEELGIKDLEEGLDKIMDEEGMVEEEEEDEKHEKKKEEELEKNEELWPGHGLPHPSHLPVDLSTVFPLPDVREDFMFPVPENGVIPLHLQILKDTEKLFIDAYFEESHESLDLHRSYTSPSDSYLQIQKPHGPLMVGYQYTLHIGSNFPITDHHYVVKARGQLVSAGQGSGDELVLVPENNWSPLACVVVYCLNHDGEIINDVIHLHVTQTPHKVSLSWSHDTRKPGQEVTLTVQALEMHPDGEEALVGILVVDEATRWAGSDNDITNETVLEELGRFGVSMGDAHSGLTGRGDPYSVFRSCDLVPLTDASLHEIQHTFPFFEHLADGGHVEQPPESPERRHFPETWIWTNTHTSTSQPTALTATVPDTITNWVASAFTMSESHGLVFMERPAELTVFLDFFLSLNLPQLMIRGEELLLEVVLFNYLPKDMEVKVVVVKNSTFEFVSPPNHHKVSVKSQKSMTVLFPIRPLVVGEIHFQVKATSGTRADQIHRTVIVKPEGQEESHHEALLFNLPGPDDSHTSSHVGFSFPEDLVPDSVRVSVTVDGDLIAPSISGLDCLIRLPSGCGEQNMINFAPLIYVLKYLEAMGGAVQETRDRSRRFMRKGYQQELGYQRYDGSFSAFGERDQSGSTWLTAFVLRCFLQARELISIDPHVIEKAAQWLVDQQGEHGIFLEPGRVIHTELQGSQEGNVSLAAYVLIGLLEDDHIKAQYIDQVSSAQKYLEDRVTKGVSSSYSLGLVCYALALAGSDKVHEALSNLIGRATMTEDGVPMWSLPHSGSSRRPRSAHIELASYVLLSYVELGRLAEGRDLMRWLSRQRNSCGGYGSTQDTVVGLQALTAFAALSGSQDPNLSIRVIGDEPGIVAAFQVNQENYLLHQSQELFQVDGTQDLNLQVLVHGRGVALFQLNVFYHVRVEEEQRRRRRDAGEHEAFHLRVKLHDSGLESALLDICSSLSESAGVTATGMAIMEVGLLSGFTLGQDGVPSDQVVRNVEVEEGKVILYLDSVTQEEMCAMIPLSVEHIVAKVQAATVIIYDYYEPGRRAVKAYSSESRSNMSACSYCGHDCSKCSNSYDDYHNIHDDDGDDDYDYYYGHYYGHYYDDNDFSSGATSIGRQHQLLPPLLLGFISAILFGV